MKEKVLSALKSLEEEHGVRIVWAIESGSRAWGFESDDSDYDVRCMHIGRTDDYLGLVPPPLQINLNDGLLDIESWDIKKFSELTLKSNPQIAEWLRSPLVYIDSQIKGGFKELFDSGCSLDYLHHHYLRMAKQNYHKYILSTHVEKTPSCKKYLYVLRALACAEYIKQENKLPPLPYKDVLPYLPKNIRVFFEKCVVKKHDTEDSVIDPEEEVTQFIDSLVGKNIPKETYEFSKARELDEYMVKTIKELDKE